MSVLDVKNNPNIYKLEKFVVINTYDTYSTPERNAYQAVGAANKTAVLRPNLLACYKVYVNIELEAGSVIKTERVDTGSIYNVTVPFGVIQDDNTNATSQNSLICPPYIASDETKLSDATDLSLTELVANNFVHPQSIIYAQRRDFKVNLVGNNTSYIDVNADGRTYKVSSLTDKSNGVSLTDADYTQDWTSSNVLDNRYPLGTSGNNGISRLFKACMVNEDSAIEYISDIDQVDVSAITAHANPNSKRWHFEVTSGTASDVKVKLVVDSGGGGGGKDNFHELNDVETEDFEVKTRGHLPQVDPSETTGARKLTGNYLNNYNLAGVENVALNDESRGATPLFAVCALEQGTGSKKVSSVVLKSLSDMMGAADGGSRLEGDGDTKAKDSILRVVAGESSDSFSSQTSSPQTLGNQGGVFNANTVFVLTASKNEVRFRQLAYLEQLGGVIIDSKVSGDSKVADSSDEGGVITVARIRQHGPNEGGIGKRHEVTFEKMSALFKAHSTTITKDDTSGLSSFFLVNANGTADPPFETAKLDPDLFSGGGGVGAGTVRYVTETNTVQLKNSNGFGGGEDPKDFLNYQPKLFGICKEDGSYEYRYFLTSAPVTTT